MYYFIGVISYACLMILFYISGNIFLYRYRNRYGDQVYQREIDVEANITDSIVLAHANQVVVFDMNKFRHKTFIGLNLLVIGLHIWAIYYGYSHYFALVLLGTTVALFPLPLIKKAQQPNVREVVNQIR
jgi:hypothetical protein